MRDVGMIMNDGSAATPWRGAGLPPAKPRQFNLQAVWDFEATVCEAKDVALDISGISSWCTSVFMDIDTLHDSDRINGIGDQVWAHTKGWMPYSFVFWGTVTSFEPDTSMEVAISGDFEGTARIELSSHKDGKITRVRFFWHIDCRHRLITLLARLVPSLMIWNHRWSMRKACRAMQDEITRRRLRRNEPTSQTPTFPHNLPFTREIFSRRRKKSIPRSGRVPA